MLLARRLRKKLGARLVLRDVSFQVESGVACAVVGRNGAGKSTLLRVISQVMRADSGRVAWRGDGSEEIEGDELRGLCGLAAPDAPLYRELSCGENLQFWARVRGLRCDEDFLRAHLKSWQLGARWGEPAMALSSGLRARLGLAVATLGEPKILLLDEPGANLDESGRELLRVLLDEQKGRGVVLVASNEPREIALCDQSIEL
jgi:heme exporter protein A